MAAAAPSSSSSSSARARAPPRPMHPLARGGSERREMEDVAATHPGGAQAQRMRRKGRKQKQLWPRTVLRKWLNIRSPESDFSADEGDTTGDDTDSEVEYEAASATIDGEQQQHAARRASSSTSSSSQDASSAHLVAGRGQATELAGGGDSYAAQLARGGARTAQLARDGAGVQHSSSVAELAHGEARMLQLAHGVPSPAKK